MNSNDIITEKAKKTAMLINTAMRERENKEFSSYSDLFALFKGFQISYAKETVCRLIKVDCLTKTVKSNGDIVYKANPDKPVCYKVLEHLYFDRRKENRHYKQGNKETLKPNTSNAAFKAAEAVFLMEQYRTALEEIGYDFKAKSFNIFNVLDSYVACYGDAEIINYIKDRGYKVMKPVKYEEV